MTYLEWLGIFFGLPLLVLFFLKPQIFFENKKIFLAVWVGSLLVYYPWDILAITSGHWSFPRGLVGITLANLPLEEYLWALGVSTLVTYLTLFF